MANLLSKNITSVLQSVGTGSKIGFAGQPFIPAYSTTELVVTFSYMPLLVGSLDGQASMFGTLRVPTFTYVTTDYPEQPFKPAVAAVAAKPPSYTLEFNTGWNAGARSVDTIAADGSAEFYIPTKNIGTVVGFNRKQPSKHSFAGIEHGIYARGDQFSVIESGFERTITRTFNSADKFTLTRNGGTVRYYRNAQLIYTSRSVPSVGVAYLDSSMYFGGDEVRNASIMSAQPADVVAGGGSGFSDVSLEPLVTLGGREIAQSFASLRAFTTSATGMQSQGARVSFQTLTTTASDHIIGSSGNTLQPLTTLASAGEPVFRVTASSTQLLLLQAAGHGFSGTTAQSTELANLQGLVTLASDHIIGSGMASVLPLQTLGLETGPVNGRAVLTAPMATLAAEASPREPNAFEASLPMPTLAAFTGAGARLRTARPRLLATGTGQVVARFDEIAPMAVLVASGVAGNVAQATLALPMATVEGFTGAVLSVTLQDGFKLAASGRQGGLAQIVVTMPLFELVASSEQKDYAQARLTAPMPFISPVSRAYLRAPMFVLEAVGTAEVALDFEAYAISMLNRVEGLERGEAQINAVTHYTNYPFSQIVRYNNTYYGIGADGLFLLEGDTDDTAPIAWSFLMSGNEFGSPQLKRTTSLYIDGRVDVQTVVTVVAGEKDTVAYNYSAVRGKTAQSYRVPIGRGMRSRYYAIGMSDVAGNYVEVSGLEFLLDELKRAI